MVRRLNQGKESVAFWWRDGFRTSPVICWRGSQYGAAFDSAQMQLLNFGTCVPDDKAAIKINPEIAKLPKATLELSVRIGDELYTCRKGGQARLIESGRFMHRMDILGLSFVNAAGKVLQAESRLEIIAWPDSFTWLLEVKPSKAQQAAKLGISLTFNIELGGERLFRLVKSAH